MFTDIVIISFVLLGVRSILYSHDGVEQTFIWIIWSFCLGYRTFTALPQLHFHPIEIFSFVCIIRIFTTNHIRYRIIPKIHKVTFFLFFLVFLIGFENFRMESANEFKCISLLYQFYFISQYIKFDESTFYRMSKSYLIPAIYISIFFCKMFLFS